jgi:8-oxo-dGTP pyrophosphatase MutT (NUDIX family)
MNYETLVKSFSKVKDLSLPGRIAHIETVPSQRLEILDRNVYEFSEAKSSAVLLYCYPKKNIMYLSLIKRTSYKGHHSGQISFPGGKPKKSDNSLFETALRECNEELGVFLKHTNALFSLSPVYIPPSNFLVTPFVVLDSNSPLFNPDPREVDYQIEISLNELIRLKVKQSILNEGMFKGLSVPCYCYKGQIIWGATAMILSEFKMILGSIL